MQEDPPHPEDETLSLLNSPNTGAESPTLPISSWDTHGSSKAEDQAAEYTVLSIETSKKTESKTSYSNLTGAVFNLTTSIIGAGIMALPATMRVLGLPLGALFILFMGVLSEISVEIVVLFSTYLNAWTYGEMVRAACGSVGRLISQLCIILNNTGILIVYLIIIGDVVSGSPHHTGLISQSSIWTDRRLVIFVTMVLVLAPLSLLKRIDSLRYSSAASVVLAVVFVIASSLIALVKGVRGELQRPKLVPSLGSSRQILDLLTVVPVMTNAFICHFNVQPIYSELEDRRAATMNRVGRISTILCVNVYIATAVSGYLLFGENTASDVLVNFDKDLGISYSELLNGLMRLGYIIHLMLVFPVINFSLRQNVDGIFFPEYPPLIESPVRYYSVTVLLLVLVYLGSAFIPNIWIAFQFTGATSGLALGFIFPALVSLRLGSSVVMKRIKELRVVAWLMLVVATVSSILGLATNVYNVITKHY